MVEVHIKRFCCVQVYDEKEAQWQAENPLWQSYGVLGAGADENCGYKKPEKGKKNNTVLQFCPNAYQTILPFVKYLSLQSP